MHSALLQHWRHFMVVQVSALIWDAFQTTFLPEQLIYAKWGRYTPHIRLYTIPEWKELSRRPFVPAYTASVHSSLQLQQWTQSFRHHVSVNSFQVALPFCWHTGCSLVKLGENLEIRTPTADSLLRLQHPSIQVGTGKLLYQVLV